MTTPLQRLRAQVFNVLHKPSPQNTWARRLNYVLAFLILSNATFVSLETIPTLKARYGDAFWAFESFSTAVFLVEYALRIWTCVEQQRYARPITGRIRYALHPLPLIDLIVVGSYWVTIDLRFLRVARLVRLLKVFRLTHFEQTLQEVGEGLARRSSLIAVAMTCMVACVYAISALVFQLEHEAQPAVFSSIPATFWWAITTLTTIGYGDMAPITAAGRACTGLVVVFGIGIFALPMAIVTAVIIEAGSKSRAPVLCGHCGRPTSTEPH